MWYGLVRYGLVRLGRVVYGTVWFGLVLYGLVWFALVRYSLVWYGLVRFGLVWFGMVCFVSFGPIFTKETHVPQRWSAAGALNRRRGRFAPRAPRA